MTTRLVIDGNSVYEIDERCEKEIMESVHLSHNRKQMSKEMCRYEQNTKNIHEKQNQ